MEAITVVKYMIKRLFIAFSILNVAFCATTQAQDSKNQFNPVYHGVADDVLRLQLNSE